MAPTARPADGLLARVNFPLYSIEMLTSRHVLVAGGGGSAKTGVANGFVSVSLHQLPISPSDPVPSASRKSTRSTTTATDSWPRRCCATRQDRTS